MFWSVSFVSSAIFCTIFKVIFLVCNQIVYLKLLLSLFLLPAQLLSTVLIVIKFVEHTQQSISFFLFAYWPFLLEPPFHMSENLFSLSKLFKIFAKYSLFYSTNILISSFGMLSKLGALPALILLAAYMILTCAYSIMFCLCMSLTG